MNDHLFKTFFFLQGYWGKNRRIDPNSRHILERQVQMIYFPYDRYQIANIILTSLISNQRTCIHI